MEKVKLDEKEVEELFENSDNQINVIVGLYKLVHPDFSKIEKLNDFPKISKDTNDYFFKKFISFDTLHHPEIIAGGAWVNNGFSSNNELNLGFLEVVPCEYITYK